MAQMMIRKTLLTVAACGAAALLTPAAQAQTAARPGQNQAAKVGEFGDWGAFTSQNARGKVCYALSQSKARTPANLKDTPGYLFVSHRPAENVRNEIAMVMGFDVSETAEGSAAIGTATFPLVGKGQNMFLRNAADEGRFVQALKGGETLNIKAMSKRNNPTTDRFSLKGIVQAIERVDGSCR